MNFLAKSSQKPKVIAYLYNDPFNTKYFYIFKCEFAFNDQLLSFHLFHDNDSHGLVDEEMISV